MPLLVRGPVSLQQALFEHLLYAGRSEFEGEFIVVMNILVITHFSFFVYLLIT